MSQNIVYIRIAVDEVRYRGCGLALRTGEVPDFHNRPASKGLAEQPGKVRGR